MSTPFRARAALLGLALAVVAGPGAAQTTHQVTTVGNSFSPSALTITQGDSVMWTNLSPNFHNVAETDCPPTSSSSYNGGFRSGDPNSVSTFTQLFDTPGTYCYLCEPHTPLSMWGTITVEAAPAVPALAPAGLAGLILALGAVGLWWMRSGGTRPA